MDSQYRPYENKEVKQKVDAFLNKLGLTNINRSQLNNFLVSVGVTCLDKTFDVVVNEMKKNEFKTEFLKFLQ